MALTAMSDYSRSILVKEGIHPPVPMRDNGGVVYPGRVVTCIGQTFPDVVLSTAISSSAFGVAGLNENQDVDTVYTDDDEFPVYTCGSGAIVRTWHKGTPGGGDIVAGDILIACEASGFVRPLSKGIASLVEDYTSTVLATVVTKFLAIMGRAMETHASATNDTPIKVLLSV
jgi:hypothetical protein